MLDEIRIQNLILVEEAVVSFKQGLNVITGETGAGKSAILGALGLVLGGRANISMIRKGAAKGCVEAEFDVSFSGEVKQSLEEAGIDCEPNSPLIIRRELSPSGKSRCFINNQMAQVSTLHRIGSHYAEIVGQHANRRLIQTEFHREVLDLFAGLQEMRREFSTGWENEKALKKQLDLILNSEGERLREIEACRRELEEIEAAELKEGEEEELFAEYTLLSNAEELMQQTSALIEILSCTEALRQAQSYFDELSNIDPAISDTAKLFKSAHLELSEIRYTLEQYRSRIDHSPSKAETINDRLGLINQLKRKYGSSLDEVNLYRREREQRLQELENAELQVEQIETQLKNAAARNHAIAETLTEKRKEAAPAISEHILEQLVALNMSKVQFTVSIIRQERNVYGDDKVEFFLTPNVGEKRVAIAECASGGELARLTLAIHTILAGKQDRATLIFDEVDANIGGETASRLGAKLKEVAAKHQVLCITHFPQVAAYADHHIQISKSENEGRTVSHVKTLTESEKEEELTRMLGGAQSLLTSS